jgi:hypothetical protein
LFICSSSMEQGCGRLRETTARGRCAASAVRVRHLALDSVRETASVIPSNERKQMEDNNETNETVGSMRSIGKSATPEKMGDILKANPFRSALKGNMHGLMKAALLNTLSSNSKQTLKIIIESLEAEDSDDSDGAMLEYFLGMTLEELVMAVVGDGRLGHVPSLDGRTSRPRPSSNAPVAAPPVEEEEEGEEEEEEEEDGDPEESMAPAKPKKTEKKNKKSKAAAPPKPGEAPRSINDENFDFNEKGLRALLKARGALSVSVIAEYYGVEKDKVLPMIKKEIADGGIQKEGEARGTKYSWLKKVKKDKS